MYYLNSRYYNPEWGRMLNTDDPGVVTATLGELTDKNLFAYCDNNPIMRVDEDGHFWETFLDIANLGYSAFNMISKASWANFGYLAWDAGATLVPFVPGSYVGKGLTVASKASSASKVVGQAQNVASFQKLGTHLKLAEKYGTSHFKELSSGSIRYYGKITPAKTQGEMIGRRLVREWSPTTGGMRTWHETLDGSGRIRQVRPVTGDGKVHYRFDAGGGYIGKW